MSVTTNEAIAARWVEGLTGNWSILETLSSPQMRVWHSHDNVWLDREAAAARMAESGGAPTTPAFTDVRALATETGFVVQGSISGLGGGGQTHIVQIITLADGLVASCEEYIAPEMNLG
jgi:hypothetical protein